MCFKHPLDCIAQLTSKLQHQLYKLYLTIPYSKAVFPAEPSSRLQVGWGENESVGKGQPTRRNGVIPVPNFGGSNFLCSCSAKIRPKLVEASLGATATGG